MRMRISWLSLSLWLASVAVGCGAAVAPVTDAGADRVTVADASVSSPDVVVVAPDAGPAACMPATPSRVLVPELLFAGQPLGLTVEVNGGSCGCSLSLAPNGLSSARGFDPTLCGCCNECDCVDPGYRSSTLLGAPGVGSMDVAITGEMQRRRVHVVQSESTCDRVGIDVRTVTVLGPENVRVTGPNLYWVQVEGVHRPCCTSAVGFVNQMQGNTFVLEPRSCDVVACERACPPVADRMPVTFTSTHLLGELRPGDYRVSVGTNTVAFTVR